MTRTVKFVLTAMTVALALSACTAGDPNATVGFSVGVGGNDGGVVLGTYVPVTYQ